MIATCVGSRFHISPSPVPAMAAHYLAGPHSTQYSKIRRIHKYSTIAKNQHDEISENIVNKYSTIAKINMMKYQKILRF